MSYKSTYLRYNALASDLKVEIKRVDSNGVYESEWKNIEKLVANQIMVHDAIPSMSYKLPNESYSYGVLRVPDCTLKLLSINGEFSSQNNPNSIFNGFVRHKTQVLISHGYKDPTTDTIDYIEVYRGFINEKSKNTKVSNDNTYQNLFIEDALTFLLKEYTFADFNVTSRILNDLVFELFNRPEFTDFLSVDVNNIKAGYNVQYIDDTEIEGQTQWLTVLQDLSIGHSYLYQKDGVIYYTPINEANAGSNDSYEPYNFQDNTPYNFQDDTNYDFNARVPFKFTSDKIINFDNYSDGVKEVFERLYWRDTALSFISPTNLYNRSKTFDIESITDSTDRLNVLAATGTRTSKVRAKYKIKVVLYVNLFILDKLSIIAGDYITDDSLVWGRGNWDEQNWASIVGAAFSDSNSVWTIKEIVHNFSSGTTELIVEEL